MAERDPWDVSEVLSDTPAPETTAADGWDVADVVEPVEKPGLIDVATSGDDLLAVSPIVGRVKTFLTEGQDTWLETLRKQTRAAGHGIAASHGGLEQQVAISRGTRSFPISPEYALEHARKMGLIGPDEQFDLSKGAIDNPRLLDALITAADDLDRLQAERIQKDPLYQKGQERAAFHHERIQELQPDVPQGSAKYYVGQATQSFFSSVLPAMAASMATGGAALPGLTLMGTQVYGQRLGEQLQKGRPMDMAQVDAMFYALSETIPETVPLGIALKQGTPFLKRLLSTAGAEGGQEMITEVLQAGYDAGILDEKMTLSEALRRVVDAGIVGGIMGGGMATVGAAYDRATGLDRTPPDLVQKSPDQAANDPWGGAEIVAEPGAQPESAPQIPAVSQTTAGPASTQIAPEQPISAQVAPSAPETVPAIPTEAIPREKAEAVRTKVPLLDLITSGGGLSRAEAEAQGIDPAYFKQFKGKKPLFPKQGGMTFDEAAEMVSQYGYGAEQYSANELLDMLDRSLRGEKVLPTRGVITEQELAAAAGLDQYLDAQEAAQAQALARQASRPSEEDIASPTLEAPEYTDEELVAGQKFEENEYDPAMTGEARALYELHQDAKQYDEAAADGILESQRKPSEIARGLHQIIQEGQKRGRPADQPRAPARPQEQGPAAAAPPVEPGAAATSARPEAEEGFRLEPQQVTRQKTAAAPATDTADLFGAAPSATQQAIHRARQEREPTGPYVPPSSGPGELFAGPRPEQMDITSLESKPTKEFGFEGLHEITVQYPVANIEKYSITTPEYRDDRVVERAGRKIKKPILALVEDPKDHESPIEIVDGWHRVRQAFANGDEFIPMKMLFKPDVERPERRHDLAQRKRVAEMSTEEMRRALLLDDLTGLPNRRAYEESDKKAVQVFLDMDSLKWINDNLGHDAGDKILREFGQVLRFYRDAYHLSGDEFIIQADTVELADAIMEAVDQAAKGVTLEFQTTDGKRINLTGLGFSYGYGEPYDGQDGPAYRNAEAQAAANKAERENLGLRARRGEPPAQVTEIAPERSQALERVPEEEAPVKPGTGLARGGLYVEFAGQKYPVDSFEDASKKWDEVRDRIINAGGGMSSMPSRAIIKDSDDNIIGNIAWNGRVFEGLPDDWTPQTKLLYENRKPAVEGEPIQSALTDTMPEDKVFPAPKQRYRAADTVTDTISQEQANERIAAWKAEAKRIGREEDHSNEVILSLFDRTGAWSQPYVDAGYDVRRYDIDNGDDLVKFMPTADIVGIKESGKQIVGVIAAPPCTSYAVSGARWWKSQHDVKDSSMVAKKYGLWATVYFDTPIDYANTLVAITQSIVEFANPSEFHVLENPVGRIAEQNDLPKPLLTFDPHHYGNPYTKLTQLWGDFNPRLPLANVEATQGSLMHKLRGDVEEDKAKRSQTPEGFAYAFFMANHRPGTKRAVPLTKDVTDGLPEKSSKLRVDSEVTVNIAALARAHAGTDMAELFDELRDRDGDVATGTITGRKYDRESKRWFYGVEFPESGEFDYAFTEDELTISKGNTQDAVDDAAAQAATSPQNKLPEPTEAQKEAGNYQKGHVTLHGLDISIENPAGSRRRPEWPPLKHHYGYIKGTKGRDKDHIDVFLGPSAHRIGPIYVIDQVNPETQEFDEHKVMLGFDSRKAAEEGYLANYEPGWKGMGPVKQFTLDEFKDWLKSGETKKPVALGTTKVVLKTTELVDQLRAAWNKYDDTGEIETHADFVNEVEATAAESTDLRAAEILDAVEVYRQEQRDDRALAGRGDMESAEAAFNDAIQAVINKKSTKPATPVTTKESPTTTGATDVAATLKAAGLTIRKTKTNKGNDVWELKGTRRDDRATQAIIKSLGGRWYGPKKVWSFYNGDPSEQLAARLPNQVKTVPQAPETQDEKPEASTSIESESTIPIEEPADDTVEPPSPETGDREGYSQARADRGEDRGPVDLGMEERDLGAGSERTADTETAGAGGAGGIGARGRSGGGREQPSGGPRDTGTERDERGTVESIQPARSGTASARTETPSKEGVSVSGRHDYTITDADEIGAGGLKTKYKNNVAAIRVLKQLEEEDRLATPDEQKVLAKYVGWGGIKGAFDPDNKDWTKEYAELNELLTEEEYEAARRSILDAHYTSVPIVRGIWAALDRMGFRGGRMLEPSVGVGNFIGLMPKSMRSRSDFFAVELDRITGAIARQLYQHADIASPRGFQDVNLPADSFDIVVGNPPFGSQKLYDSNHKDLSKFSIHNYFIAKSIDKLRPGGIMGIVVSRYFMDAQDSAARVHIANHATFLGAIRLPYTAFKDNANTEVVTDIVFFRKHTEGEWPNAKLEAWTETGETDVAGTPAMVNRYFIDNPFMVLGQFARTGSMYGKDELTVEPPADETIEAGINRLIGSLPENIYAPAGRSVEELAAVEGLVPEHVKVDAYFVTEDGKLAKRAPDSSRTDEQGQPVKRYQPVPDMPKATEERIRGLIGVRDALRDLMRSELTQESDTGDLKTLRTKLNRTYDAFLRKHGYINSIGNRRAFQEDPDLPLLESLEPGYDPGVSKATAKNKGIEPRPPKAEKAAIFTKRVLAPFTRVTKADTPKDALIASLNERGLVDLDFMSDITGTDHDTLTKELAGLMFLNPESDTWEVADEYLTGNVKAKLYAAREAAKTDKRYADNVTALEKVQPPHIQANDIAVRLGSPWVPPEIVEQFGTELLGVKPTVGFIKAVGKWSFAAKGSGTSFTATWGTKRMPADEIIESLLNLRAIVIKDNHGTSREPQWVVNDDETQAARAKADDVQQKFKDWVWLDQARRERLETIYNDVYNTNRARQFDGEHMTLPGMSPAIQLRPHQKAAIWRIIQDRIALLDHVVGAGKTFEMVGAAMELRRMGLARKPMFAVPNHLVRQWRDEFYKLYPNANILATTEKDFQKGNRERLFSRIATGDWDAVIVAHSSFKKIGMPVEQEQSILTEMSRELSDAIEEMKRERGDRHILRDMERIKERLTEKVKRLNDKSGDKDKAVAFDELGADALFVDEAHMFKNLFYFSQMQGVAGLGNPTGSGRAFDLFVKTRYLQNRFGGKGITVFATGTPVSNSLVEMYTMQRYLMYDDLKARQIHLLDSWARVFGDVQQVYEVHPSGSGYRLATRFAKFVNMPELMTLYRKFADVITMDDLKAQAKAAGKRFPVPKMKGGKPQMVVAERSPLQTRFFGVPEFARTQTGEISFKHDDLSIGRDDKGKYTVVRERGSMVAGPFETEAEAEQERGRLLDEYLVQYNEGSILWKFENLRRLTKDSDGKINALSITNEARKAGLDFRLIDSNAPDFAGSKINLAVSNIAQVYQDWNADKGTQLVFCDLSVPKAARDKVLAQAKKQAEKEQAEATEAEEARETEAEEEAPAEEEEKISMDQLLATQSSFSVYDDIKTKLIEKGIPEKEIAFIHDYDTADKKNKLFQSVRSGHIRVLLGSTEKMGAGMNVQDRLVAVHHMDAPWRPSDLEQRNGRIIRQGNKLYERDPDGFEIQEFRYATKQTYDTRMWQIIEHKARGVEQLRHADETARSVDDISGEAASAADMKAAASGNPLILDEIKLRNEVRNLEAQEKNHLRTLFDLQNKITMLEKADSRFDARMAELNRWIDVRTKNPSDPFKVEIGGKTFTERKNIAGPITEKMVEAYKHPAHSLVPAGSYRGVKFGFQIAADGKAMVAKISIDGKEWLHHSTYLKGDDFSPSGFLTRIDNSLERLDDDVKQAKRQLDADKAELVKARAEVGKPFPKKQSLDESRVKHREVVQKLQKAGGSAELSPEMKRELDETMKRRRQEQGRRAPDEPVVRSRAAPAVGGLSASEITQVAEELLGQFAHKPAVKVVDQTTDVLPDDAGADDGTSGFLFGGRIHLVRSGLGSRAEVVGTLWHELLHYGLRRYMTKDQYISAMRDLSARDAWIRRRAQEWTNTDPEAGRIRDRGESASYVLARGVDEALADLAAVNAGEFTRDTVLARTVRAVSRWIARLADRLGFKEAAARWRSVTNDEARELIRSIFTKLREGATGVYSDPGFTTDVTFARKPKIGPVTFSDPRTEARYRAARDGLEDPRTLPERVWDWLGHVYAGFTRHYIAMPNVAEFAKAHEFLRQYEAAPQSAKEQAVEVLRAIVRKLTPEEYDLFTRKVILDDLAFEDSQQHQLPFGFTSESLARDKAAVDQAVNDSPKVQRALSIRKRFIDRITDRLVQKGILTTEQTKNPAYFRHQVLTYARMWQYTQGARKLKKPKPGYAKRRHGSEEDINANYIEAEFEFMHRALVDIVAADTIEKIKDEYDIKQQLKEKAAVQNKGKPDDEKITWRDIVPEDYSIWQPDKGNVFYLGQSIGEKAIDHIMSTLATNAPQVDRTELMEVLDGIRNSLMVGGKKREMVIPAELAETLDQMRPDTERGLMDHMFATPLAMWKQWVLINPRRALKYNLNNLSGDLDAIIAGSPKALRKLGQAIRELYMIQRGKLTPSARYREAVARGVFDSGLTMQEIPDINYLKKFDNLIGGPKVTEVPGYIALRVWRFLKEYTQFRENWMRYAAYLDYVERLEAGESMDKIGYGASNPEIVDQIVDPKDRAALLARDLVGDYGNISTFGLEIRRKLIPFYSWIEINTGRYLRLIGNAYAEGIGKGIRTHAVKTALQGARLTAWLYVRMAILYLMVQLWNNLMYPDEEEALDVTDRSRLHLILGKDQDGKIRMMRFQGALSDFLAWFGFDEAVGTISNIEKGRASWLDVVEVVAKAPVNKVTQGITPLIKTPVEMASGKSFYPDVFNPRRIHDRPRELFRLFSLEPEYDWLTGNPMRGYSEQAEGLLFYKRDVGEIAFNRIYELQRDYMRSKGIEGGSDFSTPKSRAIRKLRLAKRYGDEDAEARAMDELREIGVRPYEVKQAIRRMKPLAGLSQRQRTEFLSTLDAEEQELLNKAVDYYRRVYEGGE